MIRLYSFEELAHVEDPLVVTVGFFDGVHLGHQSLLRQLRDFARSERAKSLVITFPNLPRAFHRPGIRPSYLTLAEEKLLLLEQQGIDYSLILNYDGRIASQTAVGFFRKIRSKCRLAGICLGYDTSIGMDRVSGEAGFTSMADSLGIPVLTGSPYHKDDAAIKSSQARDLVMAGKMAAAEQILGHPYFILGKVMRGKGLGRSALDIPTANIYLPPEKLCPPKAIYAGHALINNVRYPAAIAVMTPGQASSTILDRSQPAYAAAVVGATVVESHVIGYSGDLYGSSIRLDFLQFMRTWRNFKTVDELRDQIHQDIEKARGVAGIVRKWSSI